MNSRKQRGQSFHWQSDFFVFLPSPFRRLCFLSLLLFKFRKPSISGGSDGWTISRMKNGKPSRACRFIRGIASPYVGHLFSFRPLYFGQPRKRTDGKNGKLIDEIETQCRLAGRGHEQSGDARKGPRPSSVFHPWLIFCLRGVTLDTYPAFGTQAALLTCLSCDHRFQSWRWSQPLDRFWLEILVKLLKSRDLGQVSTGSRGESRLWRFAAL